MKQSDDEKMTGLDDETSSPVEEDVEHPTGKEQAEKNKEDESPA